MKKIVSITIICLMLLTGCVSPDEMNTMMSDIDKTPSPAPAQSASKIPVSAEKNDGNNEGDAEDYYIIEPKATYDPENKVAKSDYYYGYTNKRDKYLDEIRTEEEKCKKKYYRPLDYEAEIIRKENIYKVGEAMSLVEIGGEFIVNDVLIFDSIAELDKQYFFDLEHHEEFVDSDGNIGKLTRRNFYVKDGQEIDMDTSEVEVKFVIIDCTIIGKEEWVDEIPLNEFRLFPLKETDDGYIQLYYNNSKSIEYDFMHHDYPAAIGTLERPFYYDNPLFVKPNVRSHYFFNYIGKDEVHNFKLGYYVDEEYLDDMVLMYVGGQSGGYLWRDSILQKGIKLFD